MYLLPVYNLNQPNSKPYLKQAYLLGFGTALDVGRSADLLPQFLTLQEQRRRGIKTSCITLLMITGVGRK